MENEAMAVKNEGPDFSQLVTEYDETNRIIHLTARKPVRCVTLQQGYRLAEAVEELIKSHLMNKRGYLVVDYSRIIIEPRHISEYASAIKRLFETYLYPGGYARYGFEITRVTAHIGHEKYIKSSPNIFQTKDEAYAHIYNLIESNRGAGEDSAAVSSQSISET